MKKWEDGNDLNGVRLRESGKGTPIFVFPGMEGSGESCMHIVDAVVERGIAKKRGFKIILIDYSRESHNTLSDLVNTICDLIKNAPEPVVFWAQSFGNLLAAGVQAKNGVNIKKNILVSPFTSLPSYITFSGTNLMKITPSCIYRATVKPISRVIFGPVEKQKNHPFFSALYRDPPEVMQRRIAWLKGKNYSDFFKDITIKSKVWLGEEDRLVDLDSQKSFFSRHFNSDNKSMSCLIGAGHVIFPEKAVDTLADEIFKFL